MEKLLQKPIVNALIVGVPLDVLVGWHIGLGAFIGTYFASKRLYAKGS